MADMTNLFPNKAQFDTMNTLLAMIASKTGEVGIDSWYAVQQAVRTGGAPTLFPVGTQLVSQRKTGETFEKIVWDVVAHDYSVTPRGQYQHSMTLLTHNCTVNALQYDSEEALYVCENGLTAGTYHFALLADYDAEHGGGKTYQFTLTKPVPANGVIMFPWKWNTQAALTQISTYSTVIDTAAIESVAVTEGNGGTNLGTADGNTPNMNHTHRIRYGSNNWKESAMRQFLNSDAPAGQVWKPQTKFDRPPLWAASQAGWMGGLDPEFLAVVGTAKVINRTNSLYEEEGNVSQNYDTEDKFWLPSRSEIYGESESGLSDGTMFPYYDGATNIDRIKYNTRGTACCWLLRSPAPARTSFVHLAGTDGSISGGNVLDNYAVAVACAIF